jgi:hypothetical protein
MDMGPWTRGDVIDLHIFILLLIWFTMDRCNIYGTRVFHFVWDFLVVLRERYRP